MEKLKQDPKAYPRNPTTTDEDGAELATSVVRYVTESDLKEFIFPFAIDNGATDGLGGVEMMLIEGDKGDPDIGFAKVEPDSFFYDTRSYQHDFSDARYQGMGKWLDIEEAKYLAPDKADEIEASTTSMSGWELSSNPDRERRWFFYSPFFKRIRVVDIWYKHEGKWKWCLFTGAMKLDEGEGYFFDERGRSICKYIMFSAFVDHDGDRYGFVRSLKSPQDEINQRRSKGLHELNSRRIKAEDGAFSDVEVTRREAVRPDGVVIYNKGFEMEFDDNTRIANVQGQLQFLEDAKNEIENFGPNPALIGQGLEYKSGRAINLLQQAGIAELGPFVIGIRNWKLRLYRAIWCAAQRYWTAERWIRVTDSDGLAQFIQVNGVGIDPDTGLPRMVNSLGQLDVNFVLDEGPDEINMMADAYDTLIALTAQGANIPPQVLLELAPLQSSVKKKLLAMISQPDPLVQQGKVAALEAQQAGTAKTQSETALNQAKAQQTGSSTATGVVERQMDAAAKVQDTQLKGQQAAQKIVAQRESNKLKFAQEMVKTQLGHVSDLQKLAQNEQRHNQQMRHAEQKQQAALKQQRQKPASGGGGGGLK
jgi:hypothetical protein